MKNFKKHITICSLALAFILMSSFKTQDADAIIGTWKEQGGTKTIQIYKVDEFYFGKLTENLSTDENKIKPGTIIMKNFVYENGVWEGTIEIPNRDMSLKGKIVLENENQMKAIATVIFVGKSKVWDRVK
ncbi:DUF2147 domain-containing protein [Pedobacter alpinus]|uniref:DUF2147 domain-containing protein n=1 Tax=Pedobacter alpinus TaxID=1590643 RepID=A0ABW5TX34_9SPHI